MTPFKKYIHNMKASNTKYVLDCQYCNAVEYYDGEENIPDYVIEKLKAHPSYDYVFDNMQSHNWKDLGENLKKNIECIYDYKLNCSYQPKDKEIITVYLNNYSANKDLIYYSDDFSKIHVTGKLKNILDFYNYFPTKLTETENDSLEIDLEPMYPEKISYEEFNRNHGKFYHITYIGNADNINKSGLKCKNPNTTSMYRIFPSRIYFFNDYEDLLEYKNEFMYNRKYAIFEIDLSHNTNIDIYKDPLISKGAYFTYTNIPASLIKEKERG